MKLPLMGWLVGQLQASCGGTLGRACSEGFLGSWRGWACVCRGLPAAQYSLSGQPEKGTGNRRMGRRYWTSPVDAIDPSSLRRIPFESDDGVAQR